MSRSLLIAGEERWATDYIGGSLEIDLQLYESINTCRLQVRGAEPIKGEEVIFSDSSLGILFAGIIMRVEMKEKMPGASVPVWEIECDDYTALLNKKLVVEEYTGWTAHEIVADICEKYCPDITVTEIAEGSPVIQYIKFDYVMPSECFTRIAEYVNWIWDIDFQKKFKFYNLETVGETAPMELLPGGYFRNLRHSVDIQDLRNRVYVRGGTTLSDYFTHEIVADGTSRAWILPHKPHDITMRISGVEYSVGIENIHDASEFDFLMNFQEKRITASPQTPTPVAGASIVWTYKYDVDVITVIDDFVSQDLLAGVQGGDGVYEHVITDDKLDTIEAAEVAGINDLTQHANPIVKGSFETEVNGWKPGQLVSINLEDRGVTGVYLVQSVTITVATDKKYTYKIQYGGKLKGVEDFLKALFSAKEQQEVGETNILNKFFSGSEIIIVTDKWEFKERILPFKVEESKQFNLPEKSYKVVDVDKSKADFETGLLIATKATDEGLIFDNDALSVEYNETWDSEHSATNILKTKALYFDGSRYESLSYTGANLPCEVQFALRVPSIPTTDAIVFCYGAPKIGFGFAGGGTKAILTCNGLSQRTCDLTGFRVGEWNIIKISYDASGVPTVRINGIEPNYGEVGSWAHSSSYLYFGRQNISPYNYCRFDLGFFHLSCNGVPLIYFSMSENGSSYIYSRVISGSTLSISVSASTQWTSDTSCIMLAKSGNYFVSSGEVILNPIYIGNIDEYEDGSISWVAGEIPNTVYTVQIGLSNSQTDVPTSWQTVTNGEALPFDYAEDIEGYLWVKISMTSTEQNHTPQIFNMRVTLEGNNEGYRIIELDLSEFEVAEASKIEFVADTGKIIEDTFNDVSKWKDNGSGEGLTTSILTDEGVSFVRFSDAPAHFYYDGLIPFDPNRMYILRTLLRQYANPSVGGKQIYFGVDAIADDGITVIGTYPVLINGEELDIGTMWTEFDCFIKGYGTPIAGTTNSDNPTQLPEGTAYFRPSFAFNMADGNGSVDVKYCAVEYSGNIQILTNFDNQGWEEVQSGDSIPGISKGTILSGKKLQVAQVISPKINISPVLRYLSVKVESEQIRPTIGKLLKVWSKGRWANPQYCTSGDGVNWTEWQDIKPFEVVEVPYPGFYKVRADGEIEVRNYKKPWDDTDVVVGGVIVDG